ncbi:MAG: hydantoinase B/oxoprolinase family protein [Alphaproteobacteria bacterium]|nr:hydantoinase B/oxoprolinase family protein [Alphaproteobacteria bacterium]
MDMVTMSIIDSAMVAICREMGLNVQKTAYSTLFSEAKDFTCALALPNGELIAVADFIPSHIGGVPILVRSMVQEIDLATLNPGDIVVHNDPYRGGLHTPEHTMFKPIFFEQELIGFAVAIGHLVEIGGMVPGGFAGEATEVFHEGMRVPPVKIVRAGADVPEVWKLMLANVRTPRTNYGDLRALISGVDLGARRLVDLVRKYGFATFKQSVADLLDYAEARMRAELAAYPDGVYRFEDVVEDDGIEDKPFHIKVAVHVQGEEVVVDFTGSSPQAKGPINATLGVTWSASYNAILHLTDETIPRNSGCFRPIKVIAPAGTILNVNYPGSCVGGNSETQPIIVCAILGAMAASGTRRIMACEGTTNGCFVFGGRDPATGGDMCAFDLSLPGIGARPFADGNDATTSINANCCVTPTEVFETRYPWLVEAFALRPDSGGAGQFRGGLAPSKTMRCLDDLIVSQMTNRHKVPAWGLEHGCGGALGSTLYRAANGQSWQTVCQAFGKVSPSKYSNVPVRPGDRMRVSSPGGGGYGDPRRRDPALVAEDVREGYVSRDAAARLYGFEESWLSRYAAD